MEASAAADFFLSDDVVALSRKLLGYRLYTRIDGALTGGVITETEAYRGPEDRACHAYQNRRTPRTEVMFHKGGICYVYVCYGMHHLLNFVTGGEGLPHAILIRALAPLVGLDTMLARRGRTPLMSGPARVCQALGIDKHLNGHPIGSQSLWLEAGNPQGTIVAGPRVGIDYAGEDRHLPWRFQLR